MDRKKLTKETIITIRNDSLYYKEIWIACKFTTKKYSKYCLQYLNVTNEFIGATDGHRAIRIKNNGVLLAGHYLPIKINKTKIELKRVEDNSISFPELNDFFGDEKGDKIGELLLDDDGKNNTMYMAYKLAQVKTLLNPYLYEPIGTINAKFSYYVTSPDNPVRFSNSLAEITIMVIHLDGI